MQYTKQLIQWFESDKYSGQWPEGTTACTTARVGSKALGEEIQLQILLDEKHIIQDAKFKAYGDPYAIAGAAYLCDKLIGQALENVNAIGHSDIIEALSMPSTSIHTAIILEDALKALFLESQGH